MAEKPFPRPPLPMRSFETAKDMAAYYEARRRAEADADRRILPWQAALNVGDKVAYRWNYADGTPVEIFYEVKRSTHRDDKEHMDRIWPTRVYGIGYSVYCPEGEWGSTHRTAFERKLTEAEWGAAMQEIRAVDAVRQKFVK